jgi:hypothetical protein
VFNKFLHHLCLRECEKMHWCVTLVYIFQISRFHHLFSFLFMAPGGDNNYLTKFVALSYPFDCQIFIFRSIFKRSLSDGNILRGSGSPLSAMNAREQKFCRSAFPDQFQEENNVLSESSPEISTCESNIAFSRYDCFTYVFFGINRLFLRRSMFFFPISDGTLLKRRKSFTCSKSWILFSASIKWILGSSYKHCS